MFKSLFAAISFFTLAGGLHGQSFTPAAGSPYATGGTGPSSLVVADFNRDGAPDVMVANSTQAYVNSSTANYTAWLGAANGSGVLGVAHAIPFWSFDTTANDSNRALNISLQRATKGNYPAMAGASATNRMRVGNPWAPLSNAFTTSIGSLSYPGFPLLTTSTLSAWTASGDLDGDGIDDAVVTHSASGVWAAFTGTSFGGSATFTTSGGNSFTLPNSLTAFSVAVGDLNGDGKADVVIATGATSIVVYTSTSVTNSNFSFNTPVTITGLPANAQYITIADVTGDGKADLIVSTGAGSIYILPGVGDGTFGSASSITVAGSATWTAVADFNRDGKMDIAVANGANILILPGTGGGSFGSAITVSAGAGTNPVFVAAADMNLDGKIDLVTANKSDGTVSVLLNTVPRILPGPASLVFSAALNGANPPSQQVVVNFDAGGAQSFTTSASMAGGGSWLSVDSPAGSPITVSVNIGGLPAGYYTGTITITPSSGIAGKVNVSLRVAAPSGTLTKQSLSFGGLVASVADINGDGKADVLEYQYLSNSCGNNQSDIIFHSGDGAGNFPTTIHNCVTGPYNGEFPVVADFNGDGKLDLALGSSDNPMAVRVFMGDGAGHFANFTQAYNLQYLGSGMVGGDFNNDGKMDLAAVTFGPSGGQPQIAMMLNDGAGNFTPTFISIGAVNGNPYGLAIGDFNRDGYLDLLVPQSSANNILFLPGLGNGFFGSATTNSGCSGPRSVSAADLNGDGKLDFTVGCTTSPDTYAVYMGAGDGTFTKSPAGAVFSSGIDHLAGDFDGDGILDLAYIDSSQRNFTIAIGDGTGNFTSPGTVFNNGVYVNTPWALIMTADFNSDGRLDMIFPQDFGGGAWLYFGDLASTTTTVTSNPATSAPAGQSVAFTATIAAGTASGTNTPSWAIPTGLVTMTDTVDGQIGQGNAVGGAFTTNNALSGGVHSITASYAGDSRTKASNSNSKPYAFTVFPAHLTFTTAPVNTAAGATMASIVVKVFDSSNVVVGNSTVAITLSLDHGSFSAGATTVNAVAGVATFTGIKINGVGPYVMTASASGPTSTTANFNITAGSASKLLVSGFPSPTVANVAHNFTVTAQDAGGNTVTNFADTVVFTSSDGAAVLPVSYTFVAGDNGVHTFSANLKTVGTQSITATDAANNSIAGTQSGIVVQVGSPATLTPNPTPQSATVNTTYGAMTVTLTDAGGNPIGGQTITFSVPGSGASGTFAGNVTTADTNASGVATVPTFTANTIAGSFNLHAALGAVSTNFALTNLADFPNTVTIQGGNNQSTAINTVYSTPLSVLVKDQYNNPVSGTGITFSMPNSGPSATFPGSALTASVNTNSSGIATAPTLTANGIAGAIAPATAGFSDITVTFKLTNLTGAPAHLNITAGNNQSTLVGTAFATQFTANVTDSGNNPIQNVSVTFTAPSSNQSGAFPGSSLTFNGSTDASGNITAPVFTANTVAGAYNVVAGASSLTANIGLTNTPGPAIMTIVQGDGQSAAIGADFATALKVKIADSFSNPYSGVAVTFTPAGATASAAFTGATTVNTDATGIATAPKLTANNQTGSYTVNAASTTPALTRTFNLSNTFGPPAILTAFSGTPQSTVVNTNFAQTLTVHVTDAGSNALSGVTITFTAPASGASGVFSNNTNTITALTDIGGSASVTIKANTVAGGPYNVAATVNALTANFALTNTAGAPILTINGGNNQSAVTTFAFATPLSVKIADSFGNPYNGVVATFTAPSSGASGTFANSTVTTTATTNASGIATAGTFTANGTLGAYSVGASAPSTSAVSFSLSNITGPPTSVLAIAGTPQSALVGAAFATPFKAKVTDAAGNPLQNVLVTFSVAPAGNGASGTFTGSATISTLADGTATAPAFTANTVAGAYTVKATAGALNGTFSLTNTPGPPAIMTAAGTPQTAFLNANYAAFAAKITDASNNPLSGLTVTFTINPVAGAGGAFPGGATATAVTDSSGTATAPALTANGTLGAFTVTAKLASPVLTTTFNFTNIVNPPASLIVVSGSGQNTQGGTGYPLPLTAKVLDAQGNPLNNVPVTFTAPSSGPSASFNGSLTFTGTTNSQGLVTTPALSANQSSGSFNVVAGTASLTANFLLTIGGPPALTIDPPGFFFHYDQGTGFPAPQTGNVDNALGELFASSNQTWAKVRVLPGGNAYPTGILVSIDPTGIDPGQYFANITLTSGTRSLVVRVTLVVAPRPQISSGVTNLTFRYLVGGPVPPEQRTTINGLSRNIPFTLVPEQITAAKGKWLNVLAENNAATTPAILHVSMTPAGINPGTYQGVIHVVAPDATNSPYDIGVTLIVTAPVIPPVITSIVNAASFQNSDIAGNEILSLFGTNLACAVPAVVLLDGLPVLVLGGTDKQVNWVAPDLTGRATVKVQYACGTNVSDAYTMKVVTVAPGIFTADGKQVAAFNAGFTLNGPLTPIARGKVVMLFGTGFGPFNAPDASGLLTQSIPVTVTVGGVQATATFAGAAPGLPGVNQINVLIPDTAPAGPAVSLVISQGGTQVPAGLTVAIGPAADSTPAGTANN